MAQSRLLIKTHYELLYNRGQQNQLPKGYATPVKILLVKDKPILISLNRRRHLATLKRQKRSLAKQSVKRAKVKKKNSGSIYQWVAPEKFNIVEKKERELFTIALYRLRSRILGGQKNIILDFSNTRIMNAEATLLFVAEIRTLFYQKKGNIQWELIPSETSKVMQVLKQIKVLELLGVSYEIDCNDEDVVSWLYASGQGADGSKFDDIMGPYQGDIAPALSADLYSGVTEAMTNVVNHAYSQPRDDGLAPISDRDWWMFSTERDGRLTVLICDLGAGIPGTLPYSSEHKGLWRRLLRLNKVTHSTIIAYAVEHSITRTELSHRGKGLGQITKAIQHINNAQVTIMSNNGAYQRTSSGEVKLGDYSTSILSTLILWEIPLQPEEKKNDTH